MSVANNKNYLYNLKGRGLQLYKIQDAFGSALNFPDQLGRFGENSSGLIYPDTSITDGLKFEYTQLPADLFVDEDPLTTAQSALTTAITISETTYVNLPRMLELAVVDYVRAMYAERGLNIELKEYYMKEFWKKVSNYESNRVHVHRVVPNGALNLR
jgi:hypothetical protein